MAFTQEQLQAIEAGQSAAMAAGAAAPEQAAVEPEQNWVQRLQEAVQRYIASLRGPQKAKGAVPKTAATRETEGRIAVGNNLQEQDLQRLRSPGVQ